MAYSQTDLDRINKAIASGTMTVEIDGQRISYRTMAELMAAKRDITAELAASSTAGVLKSTVASFRRD